MKRLLTASLLTVLLLAQPVLAHHAAAGIDRSKNGHR
jgi:hypothetical protein